VKGKESVNNLEDTQPLGAGAPDTDHVLLSVVLAWIFTEIIPPLIATCFYATEGEGTGSRILFYRKQEWEALRAAGEAQMRSHFVKVLRLLDGMCVCVCVG
jgi:hypothetical protein